MKALGDKHGRERVEAVGAPEKSFYEESIGEGIAPGEGVEVFKRILAAAPAPQVVVSTKDLAASMARADAFIDEQVSEEIEKLQVARPLHPRPDMQTPYAAPRNDLEQMLAGIMQEALGVDRVGVHDNFFELGGDSVLGIQIISRVNRAGWQITPQQIFQHQTIAELAEAAVKTTGAEASSRAGAHVVEEAPARPTFELGGMDESKLSKLSQLLGADDETDDEEETVEEVFASPSAVPGVPVIRAADVESALRQHPSVREAAVVARHGNGDDGLVAYVVLDDERTRIPETKQMGFSLFYFAADDSRSGADKYRLYLEGANYADRHGFEAVWTPERHFHESGGLYPNPSVLSAALAATTEHIKLRAGSVVLPLHHSIRVAEEWSMIDNLSRGRVGLSFTAGWIPNDFAFFPERFANKREEMLRGIEEVQSLWRGHAITARDGAGKSCELKILPRPVQPELPVWLTCSGDPQMFVKAGELGLNVLTALLSQSVEEVAGKLELYREARARHGHDPDAGHVTVMLHTFVGDDERAVLDKVRGPLTDYLKAHVGLIETMTQSLDIKVDIDKEQYLDYLVAFAFERYYQTASLIGTPDKCLRMVKQRLGEIGVNEVACFHRLRGRVGDGHRGLENPQRAQTTLGRNTRRARVGEQRRGVGDLTRARPVRKRKTPAAHERHLLHRARNAAGDSARNRGLSRAARTRKLWAGGLLRLAANHHRLSAAHSPFELQPEVAAMRMKNVEDIYPLSPMQEGILFHTRHDPVFAMYFEIITWVMRGEVNIPAFGQAWQRVVDRHQALRTVFVWEGLDKPLQVVRQRAKLPLAYHDWREMTAERQEELVTQFYAAERQRGFDLAKAPLMRVALIQMGEDNYRFVWSYYHGLVDGWSGSLILNDVFAAYEGLCRGVEMPLPTPSPFRHYIDWLQRQDLPEAHDYWRRTLKGFRAATPIGIGGGAAAPGRGALLAPEETRSYREQQFNFPEEMTAELVRLSRQHKLTLNTVCQGAWALLLSRYSGEQDVVFGVAVSGRPPTLEHVLTTIGMFINTLPARVAVAPEQMLIPWLKRFRTSRLRCAVTSIARS